MFNKEKILEQSRNSNTDEGVEYFEIQGYKLGLSVCSALFIFITFFNALSENPHNYGVSALYWAFIAASVIPKYKFTQKKSYLAITVICGIASIASLMTFIVI